MTGEGIITKLTDIKSIPGADRIVQATILGDTVIVSNNHKEGEIGILFDCESVLSPEFLKANNLYRHEYLNADTTVKGMFEDNGRVRPIRLKGIKVSAFWIPINSLDNFGQRTQSAEAMVGTKFNEINGHKIVEKYVPKFKEKGSSNQEKAVKVNYVPTFKEHFSTDHLLKSIGDLKDGEFVLTKKLHGTSCRIGHLQARKPSYLEVLDNKAKNPNRTFLRKLVNNSLFRRATNALMPNLGGYDYRNVVGSRTVVKSVEGLFENTNQGFYDNDIWSKASRETFQDNLIKGETVYFEIVGYDGEKPLMSSNSTKSLEKFLDKADYKKVVDTFGDTINYNYGTKPGEYDVYIYRITMTNEDGVSIDLSWDQVVQRAAKLGVKTVPRIGRGYLSREKGFQIQFIMDDGSAYGTTDQRDLPEIAEEIANKSHHNGTYAEGFCARQEGYPECKIYKVKCFAFKVLEGIVKDQGEASLDEQN